MTTALMVEIIILGVFFVGIVIYCLFIDKDRKKK
jgi:hypothetical protein